MKIYQSADEFNGCKNAVVTTGTFDGVHIGHQKIINRLKEVARTTGGETILMTFHPHPRLVLFPEGNDLKLLNTIEERIVLIEKSGIDHLIIQPFTREFSRISSLDFVRNILVAKLETKKLVIGYNHHFGRNREGTFAHLKEFGPVYGFDVEEIPAQDIDSVHVSSTKIRTALADGDIDTVTEYLGHQYAISGTIVPGKKLGRKLGFPTANLSVDRYKALPKDGVYGVYVLIENVQYKGMMNIGIRPTVSKNAEKSVEVHIFGFNDDLYSKNITLLVINRIRNEMKFENIGQLRQQLEMDKVYILNAL